MAGDKDWEARVAAVGFPQALEEYIDSISQPLAKKICRLLFIEQKAAHVVAKELGLHRSQVVRIAGAFAKRFLNF